RKPSRMTKAKLEFKKNISEKQRLKEERQAELQEKQAMLAAKKEEALRRNKKFSQKTKRGQPLMSARLDLLIEKINTRWGSK
ncbi:Fyv7/TAP26, partial [Trinorchestia longiramus]